MHHLFVYGTLRPGGSNHDLLECANSTVAPATAAGLALYSNASGTYPYATPHPHSQITGALITVPHGDWPAIVARLDMLEGYDPHTDNGHYLRRRRTIHTGANGATEAWIYLAGPRIRLGPDRRIHHGDWLHHTRQPA